MMIWLVGLSGAGKSAIGRALHEKLKQRQRATVLVDGDEIRAVFAAEGAADYSLEGRRRNFERMRAICAWLDRQDVDVVCCILAVFPELLDENRRMFQRYFEIFVDAPMDVLARRNPKDLYGKAARGEMRNVVGVDIPFAPPRQPDMTIRNGEPPVDIAQTADRIIAALAAKGWVP